MEINEMNDIMPHFNKSRDITTQSNGEGLLDDSMTAVVDFYENLNLVTFEKSLSRLQGNYSLQLKINSLGTSDHHQ